LPSTGIPALDRLLGETGYPEKSTVLIVGPPGIGKEALGYWFIKAGLEKGDFCLYATRLSAEEVLEDQRAFEIETSGNSLSWLTGQGGQLKLDSNDLPGLLEIILGSVKKNVPQRIRIVVDFLSTLLALYPTESVYKFSSQLAEEVKRYNAVLVATIEENMHRPEVVASLVQIFDGFIEMSFYRSGLSILPLMRIGKMRGLAPRPEYYRIKFAHSTILLEETMETEVASPYASVFEATSNSTLDESKVSTMMEGEIGTVFQYLLESFLDDYYAYRLSVDQSGWRTRGEIAESTKVPQMSLYGRESKMGPILKELLSKGLVEQRFFAGQRGRGGEIIKFRIAYEKESVRRFVEKAIRERSEYS